jgi:hypothetical protein
MNQSINQQEAIYLLYYYFLHKKSSNQTLIKTDEENLSGLIHQWGERRRR